MVADGRLEGKTLAAVESNLRRGGSVVDCS